MVSGTWYITTNFVIVLFFIPVRNRLQSNGTHKNTNL